MSDFHDVYRFQVSTWLPGNNNPKSLFEKGYWMEYARCQTRARAEEVALCLSLRHPSGVQVAQLAEESNGGRRFVGYLYLPPEASNL